MWVRGLKQEKKEPEKPKEEVAPRVGAWIETFVTLTYDDEHIPSHPVWVRGLKPHQTCLCFAAYTVAPRVGAWIETQTHTSSWPLAQSHPVWVRGLKQAARLTLVTMERRTPCGCVD